MIESEQVGFLLKKRKREMGFVQMDFKEVAVEKKKRRSEDPPKLRLKSILFLTKVLTLFINQFLRLTSGGKRFLRIVK